MCKFGRNVQELKLDHYNLRNEERLHGLAIRQIKEADGVSLSENI